MICFRAVITLEQKTSVSKLVIVSDFTQVRFHDSLSKYDLYNSVQEQSFGSTVLRCTRNKGHICFIALMSRAAAILAFPAKLSCVS